MRFQSFVFATTILATPLCLAAQPPRTCVHPDDFHLLPDGWQVPAGKSGSDATRGVTLTPVPVDIDPLGAVGEVPWLVHIESLNVRNLPSTSQAAGSAVVGSLSEGTSVAGEYNLILESDEEWVEFDFQGQPRWVSVIGLTRPHPTNVDNLDLFPNLPVGEEIVNRWWGIPISYEPNDLVQLPATYTTEIPGRIYQLRSEAAASVQSLIDAARADGVNILVGSPYRSGPTQQSIYLGNMNSAGLNQRFSAPPGHSEHQLGTTVDFTDPDDGRFLSNTDTEYIWLTENAASFGWRQTYTADNLDETGYIEEPWHWRFIGAGRTLGSDLWLTD